MTVKPPELPLSKSHYGLPRRFINTPIHGGVTAARAKGNRFNGFSALWPSLPPVLKPLETVLVPLSAGHTPMNGGVNEMPCCTGQTPSPGVAIMRTAALYDTCLDPRDYRPKLPAGTAPAS